MCTGKSYFFLIKVAIIQALIKIETQHKVIIILSSILHLSKKCDKILYASRESVSSPLVAHCYSIITLINVIKAIIKFIKVMANESLLLMRLISLLLFFFGDHPRVYGEKCGFVCSELSFSSKVIISSVRCKNFGDYSVQFFGFLFDFTLFFFVKRFAKSRHFRCSP